MRSLHGYRLSPGLLPRVDNVLELTANDARVAQHWLSEDRREGYRLSDSWVQGPDVLRARIASANELEPTPLDESEVRDVIGLLESLTDPGTAGLDALVQTAVPSGLPVLD